MSNKVSRYLLMFFNNFVKMFQSAKNRLKPVPIKTALQIE